MLAIVKNKLWRSLKEPGTAYNDRVLGGKDSQVGHIKDYDAEALIRGLWIGETRVAYT